MAFSYALLENNRSLCFSILKIQSEALTGLLVIEIPTASQKMERKEIAFEGGEPLAIRSTRAKDRLLSFLRDTKLLSESDQNELAESFSSPPSDQELISWMLSTGRIEQDELTKTLEAYFLERCFDLLCQVRGRVSFHELKEIPEKVKSLEAVRPSASIKTVFWSELRKRWDKNYCFTRLQTQNATQLQIVGKLGLNLGSTEMDRLKDLEAKPVEWRRLELESLILLAVGLELGQLKAVQSGNSEISSKLKEILSRKAFEEVLGVDLDADISLLKKQHQQLIRDFHPDRLPKSASPELRSLCEDTLAHINEAYSVLSHPEKREEYLAEREIEKLGGRGFIEKKIQAEFEYEEIRKQVLRKNYQQAYEKMEGLKDYLADDPGFMADLLFCQAMVATSKTRDEQLLREIQSKISALSSQQPQILYYEGVLLKLLGQEKQAIRSFEKVLAAEPNHMDAVMEMRVLSGRDEKKSKSWFGKKGSEK
ncbi:MAG: hypothetical protein EA369_06270 [Bradymonadales bacterium]|nr:MAG: hypothetical protein EA369_06270 [Bradymonadales bacterium]